MMRCLYKIIPFGLFLSAHLLISPCFAKPVLNIYLSGGVVSEKLITAFENETGINVNVSTYDSNETMYAKLRASKKNIYDIVLPSSYYIERMKKHGLLTKIDHSQLKNLNNLDPAFVNNSFDPNNEYHIPLIWGSVGIFYNHHWIKHPPRSWRDLWAKHWTNQLMLVDDIRDIFSITLISLGYDPNDTDPEHIKAAYLRLLSLVPNIKLFTVDAMQSLMIDEDANLGVTWSPNVIKARTENPNIRFIYPSEGFVIWIDSLAIPKDAPHPKEAYLFIDYLLRATSGAQILQDYKVAVTNQASWELLPKDTRKDYYPSSSILKRAYYQRDVGEETLEIYNNYWELLKLAC